MGDSALQKGGYHHTTIISQNDTVQGSEAFTPTWIHSLTDDI